ncbi:hypothetical protein COU60_04550 [Candidatus Pacearchaeota archaeon CG10_big_fil_rev_8_21_14_0_10_34_76]|nr:MAG: hypothetical protein COU60_04550 [Candidatus Pacearchaeota archaeon CG10_big_fil_rev_8_21_14_0_10_34_76]
MQGVIKEAILKIEEISMHKPLRIISHFDTDGITSAAIFSRALQRWEKPFTLEIVKNINKEYLDALPEDHLLIFLDLASGSLNYLANKKTEVIILDHHEIVQDIPKNVTMINPQLQKTENCSSAAICYLFARELSEKNKDLANLAILGMVGDQMEKNLNKTYDNIMKDADTIIRKGLLLYPATRPLDKVLEYSSSLYIPDVTGSFKGVVELLREAGIEKTQKGYKSLVELSEEEMSNLTTAILIRRKTKTETSEIIGNIYLTKFFNNLEDARELSAMINACSRMGVSESALGFCLGNKAAKKDAEKTYLKYRQAISAALKSVSDIEKINGKNYTIINAKDRIKDTIIGTVASIISFSPLYPKGTIIIAMAYDNDKIKVSARLTGKEGRNVREILSQAVIPVSGEVGGHPNAAGAIIPIAKEQEFIQELQNKLDLDLIKI